MASIKKIQKQLKNRKVQQNLSLLAIASGGINNILENKLQGEFEDAVRVASSSIRKVVALFPEELQAGKKKNTREATKNLRRLFKRNKVPASFYTGTILSSLSQFILEDLSKKFGNPTERLAFENAIETVKVVNNLYDPDGDQYDAYEIVNDLLKSVYKEIKLKM